MSVVLLLLNEFRAFNTSDAGAYLYDNTLLD